MDNPTISPASEARNRLIRYTQLSFDERHQPAARLIGASFAPALVLPAEVKPAFIPSPYAMSAAMLGRYKLPEVDQGICRRGKLLEATTVAILRDEGHAVEPLFHYLVDPANEHFVASPDYLIDDLPFGEGKAPVSWDGWLDDTVPLYPQLQAQWTMMVAGTERHMVSGLLVDRMSIDLKKTVVVRHEPIIALMRERATAMLDRIANGLTCDPDESDSSYRALMAMVDIKPVETITLDAPEAADRLVAWRQAKLDSKAAEAIEESCRNWFAVRAGDAGIVDVCGIDRIVRKRIEPNGKSAYWRWNV